MAKLTSLLRRFGSLPRCLAVILRSPSPAGRGSLAKRAALGAFSLREKVAEGRMRVSFCLFLSALGLAWLPGCNSPDITPVVLRVMTYNIHHAEGLDGKVDLERIANVIRQSNADIVALQEVDKNTRRTGGIDMPADLARRTGMNIVFGAT
ncbi:MAG: hypothetical protein JKX86_07725 [Verrucomicrobiales bacterium]|nr:hypothetical protein [Verrucomicrobiales bacterium]